jgi:putative heme-binding domain-containing protein
MQELLESLVAIVGGRNRPDEVGRLLDALAASNGGIIDGSRLDKAQRMVLALAQGARRSGGQIRIDRDPRRTGAALVARIVQRAVTRAKDERTPERVVRDAIDVLSTIDPDGSRAVVLERLAPRQPLAVQVAVVQAMAEGRSASVADILLPRLRAFEPAVRTAAIRTLLSRVDWTKSLLRATQQGAPIGISPGSIDPADRTPLLKHRDPEIARLALALLGGAATDSRAAVIADYTIALKTKGDAASGANVFERECKTCHKVGDRGFALGPDLTGSPSADPAALLANILDPSAVVQPGYLQYMLVDQSGRTYSGIIAAETATSLTLRRGDGAEDTILRTQIAEITSTGLSIMPEAFEKTISKSEMADLIAFLRVSHRGAEEGADADDRSRPLDIGTLPGLIEPHE